MRSAGAEQRPVEVGDVAYHHPTGRISPTGLAIRHFLVLEMDIPLREG
jgi:hypothetical protein